MAHARESKTEFLNVDLDIDARFDLTAFAAATERKLHVINNGPGDSPRQLGLELHPAPTRDPESTLRRMLDVLETLPPRVRSIWNRARSRCLDIGIQAGTEPRSFRLKLSSETLRRAARLKAELAVTVYACDVAADAPKARPRRKAKTKRVSRRKGRLH